MLCPPPIPHSTMATNLQLLPIHGFPLSSWKCPKYPQRVPVFSLQPLNPPPPPPPSPKSILSSRRRASVAHAVKEEVIQSPNSDPALGSKTSPPASSKLVLVVGGSGGVGMHLLLLFNGCQLPSLLVFIMWDFSYMEIFSGFCCYWYWGWIVWRVVFCVLLFLGCLL